MNRRGFLKFSLVFSGFITAPQLTRNYKLKKAFGFSDWVIEILGSAQDGGVPHFGCTCNNCNYYREKGKKLFAASIGLYNLKSRKFYLFDATPDIKDQLEFASINHKKRDLNLTLKFEPDGIFLTHAHMGHYTGLTYYGFESVNSKNIPVYCSKSMADYLTDNGPWSQLVKYNNINLKVSKPGKEIDLGDGCRVIPYTVPHRQEFTDTFGFKIKGPTKSLLYIPDIDRWEQWDRSIIEEVKGVNYAVLDGTFFSGGELPGRNMSKIPHPTVKSSIELLKNTVKKEKNKVFFTHLNHSNPLVIEGSPETKFVQDSGFYIAREGDIFEI